MPCSWPEVVGAPSGDAPRKRTGPDLNRCEQQGRERKVTRSIEIGYGCGYGYGLMSDPQGMPLTGIAPWGQRPLRSVWHDRVGRGPNHRRHGPPQSPHGWSPAAGSAEKAPS